MKSYNFEIKDIDSFLKIKDIDSFLIIREKYNGKTLYTRVRLKGDSRKKIIINFSDELNYSCLDFYNFNTLRQEKEIKKFLTKKGYNVYVTIY